MEKQKVAAALANDIADVAQRLRQMLQDLWPHAPSPALREREIEVCDVILSDMTANARRLLLGSNPEALDRRMRSLLDALDREVRPFFPAGRLSSKWYLGSVVTPAVLFNFYLTVRVDLVSASSSALRIDALLDEGRIGGAATLTQGRHKLQLEKKTNLEIAETTAGPGYRIQTKIAAPPAPWDLEAWDDAGSVSVSIRSAEGGGVKLKSTISAPSVALIFPDGISELEFEMVPLPTLFPQTASELRVSYEKWQYLALALAGVVFFCAAPELAPVAIAAIRGISMRLAIAGGAVP